MGAPEGSGWRGRRRLPLLMLLACGSALGLTGASAAEGPVIEATSDSNGYFVWRPPTATIGAGGSVAFKSPSQIVPHGVTWTGGPATPSCDGVPIEQEKTGWSGSCAFAQAGNYTFVCTVHPIEMKGTIFVGSTAPPAGGQPPGGSTESPLQGSASQAVKVARNQHGNRVRGSVALSHAGAGGKLEIQLYAKRSVLSGSGAGGTSRVGRLVRSQPGPGRTSFSVPLKAAGRRALARLRKLSLSVKIVVTPPGGAAVTLRRGVVLHA